jgi:hypothetical protein
MATRMVGFGEEGTLEVSNWGEVREAATRELLHQSTLPSGTKMVRVQINGKRTGATVQQLVARPSCRKEMKLCALSSSRWPSR